MSENMMCPDHKATNEVYREEYDRIFGRDNFFRAPLIKEIPLTKELRDDMIYNFPLELENLLQEDTNGKTKRVKK